MPDVCEHIQTREYLEHLWNEKNMATGILLGTGRLYHGKTRQVAVQCHIQIIEIP